MTRTGRTVPRVVVMGVAGCGKSTVGSALARRLGVPFVDADGLHPHANVARMSAGVPLTDDDRAPWLAAVAAELAEAPRGLVVACSALRRRYRDALRAGAPGTVFVHLTGTREILAARLGARLDHFMPPALLDSQLATLEPLDDDEPGWVLNVVWPPDELAEAAADRLRVAA
ncbi:gluconokinase [Cellulomonas sp. S1-8]|uniref:gluconokinase n=1 Tax=Cellulomonas sp. S1-8 TaxID=2904790 RepID=UPI0022446645|nr:gluconokinase [Cellulomonas sp. S1-8]UZN04285.1 gluconokinase [Cellulomonas sp. S1-8]